MRNPLAEPYLLGVSGGAAVGAIVAVTMLSAAGPLIPIAAFSGALVAVICVLGVARAVGRGADPRVVVMAGVVVGAFANAVVIVCLTAITPDRAHTALWWMMGSVAEADWRSVSFLSVYLAGGLVLLTHFAPEIDALALGDDSAASLGVNVNRDTWRIFVITSLLAAATVAAAGLIGFVGLVVPHIARAFGIRRQRELILASALAGGALLTIADILARVIAAPRELPLGAVTAIIGVPYFLLRLRSIR
jgi:iron complex transport system permease protein